MLVEDRIIQTIGDAVITGDVGLVKAILDYKPTEYVNLIQKMGIYLGGIDIYIQKIDINIMTLFLEYGVRMNGNEMASVISWYGFDKSKHLLEYRQVNIQYTDEMVQPFYSDSADALEWLRNSGIPNVFGNPHELIESVIESPDIEKFTTFFFPLMDSTVSKDTRWWSTIYQDFPLDNLVNGTSGVPSPDVVRKERISGIVDLFVQNIKTPEEYAIMSEFVDTHPEYELPGTFIPSNLSLSMVTVVSPW